MGERLLSARWAFDCQAWKPNLSELIVAVSGIQQEEKERIGKFVFQKDAKSSLIGRLLMRKFVSETIGTAWGEIKLLRDENGKPYWDVPGVNFNVSHQGRYTILAGEIGDVKIGTDVMEMKYTGGKDISEFFRLMAKHFTNEEWMVITEPYDEKSQIAMFFRHWCLKESFVKATGTGITVDLGKINFKLNTKLISHESFNEDTEVSVNGKKQDNWTFQEILLPGNYCACVALSPSAKKMLYKDQKFSEIKIDDIINSVENITHPDEKYCIEFLKKRI
ncbi:L-aminoadipate-semialdehyde dehydrogenase-phosphopantetheinyl transferase [Cimex lectularius]|uniref:L-aminoadipate-semialdehyde dehydrogenase-phosphopantetheinyl transferase n=1 Tax=Cimex lectularius TaxID=79782 RepID=A0A8I6SS05_CIMLE|nr:L-aminoadipate-semialdehyde dehydrogenase-phosphopantetheinyl transferase [Cimex lectularius]